MSHFFAPIFLTHSTTQNQKSKMKSHLSRLTFPSFSILYFLFSILPAPAATVFGTLQDISIQGLNTKLMFSPTNEVLLVPSGLSAGPPKIITTANGAFSLPLE